MLFKRINSINEIILKKSYNKIYFNHLNSDEQTHSVRWLHGGYLSKDFFDYLLLNSNTITVYGLFVLRTEHVMTFSARICFSNV